MKGQWRQMKGGALSHYFIARDKVTGVLLSSCDLKCPETVLEPPVKAKCDRCKEAIAGRA